MTKYKCRECTGRAGRELVFEVWDGGEPYEYDPKVCPVCTQSDYIEEKE